MITLRNKDGESIIQIDVDKQEIHLPVSNGDIIGIIIIPVYYEHLEKFAIELLKATGHKLDPKEI